MVMGPRPRRRSALKGVPRGESAAPDFEIIVGRHSVRAALLAGRRTVTSVLIDRDARGDLIDEIKRLGHAAGAVVNMVVTRDLDQLAGGDFHQGVGAYAAKLPEPSWNEIIAAAHMGNPVVIVDHVADPRNLGAIIRTAAAFGAGAVICPLRRQAPVTPATAKAAEGGLEFVPLRLVANVVQAVNNLKAGGVWCYALEGTGKDNLAGFKFAEAAAFVFGSEEAGVSAAVLAACDAVVSISVSVNVPSLNVAAAAAVALFAFRSQHPV